MMVAKHFYEKYWHTKRLGIDELSRLSMIISMIKRIKIKDPNILDLGCGRGWLTYELSKFGKVKGSDQAINSAKKMFPNIKFFELDLSVDKIPEKYDIIVCSEVIEHMVDSDQENLIKKIYDALHDGGYLILTTPNKPIVDRLLKVIHDYEKQPLENFIPKNRLIKIISKRLSIQKFYTTMFFPIFFRKFRPLFLIYNLFYQKIIFYRFIDPIFKKTKYGLYVCILAKK